LWGELREGGIKEFTHIVRKLRNEPTEAEKHLWQELRFRSREVKFCRQAVIGRYIVDFACFWKKSRNI
jgi:very-short-patch-repair endonuclease